MQAVGRRRESILRQSYEPLAVDCRQPLPDTISFGNTLNNTLIYVCNYKRFCSKDAGENITYGSSIFINIRICS